MRQTYCIAAWLKVDVSYFTITIFDEQHHILPNNKFTLALKVFHLQP